MNPRPRYLTKSRFKLAMECPTKLFYTGKSDVYADENLEDTFLKALAEGGFQVGELAKAYFPDGQDIQSLDYEEALAQTSELLKQNDVIIYEAAVRFKNLFIRADILVRKGNRIDLIEVKAKSYDAGKDRDFIGARGGIASKWKPYLLDVAFQKYVAAKAFPKHNVFASLMLVDKSALCPSEGLHQKFRIVVGKTGRKRAEMTEQLTQVELQKKILCQVDVGTACDLIDKDVFNVAVGPTRFVDRIRWLAEYYERDEKIISKPTPVCAHCEFRATAEEEAAGKKSGFKECWKKALKWKDQDFETPNVLNIWSYRNKITLMEERRIAMAKVVEDDIAPKPDDKPGFSRSERQWMQVRKVQTRDTTIEFDREGLTREMSKWRFPLHFIDFETTRVAIPFNQGRLPYELVAFQFSHHVVEKDGGIRHQGQYLNTERGVFPNYDFVRALKKELEGDEGTIFRYATHENSTLAAIDRQLAKEANAPKDRAALQQFIRAITTAPKDSVEQWNGKRTMVDLCEMVKRYYYAPATNGSNSIKAVLPAVLNQSEYLQKKYAQPIYGGKGSIPSKNFRDKIWIKLEGDQVIDPYKQLPKMFADVSEHDFEWLTKDDELKDGGAAMTAYARMQFEEMGDRERSDICEALLRYCELDTLAMVMIYEAWRELIKFV